jgi:hypothetical protein
MRCPPQVPYTGYLYIHTGGGSGEDGEEGEEEIRNATDARILFGDGRECVRVAHGTDARGCARAGAGASAGTFKGRLRDIKMTFK